MFKWLVLLNCPYLLDADNDGGGGGDDLDALGDLDDKDDTKDEDKDNDKSDEESDDDSTDADKDDAEEEEKDDDEEEKDDDEEEKDEDTDDDGLEEDRLTHVKDIKKAYPDFFKKFPDVKAAMYRDQEYAELFGSPKEAGEISKRAGILSQVENDLFVEANPVGLLDAVKKSNPESFKKIAFKILPYLQESDKETYLEVASLPIKQLLRNMTSKFDPKSNEYKAALYVHKYFFEDLDVNKKVSAEEKAVTSKSAKELEFEQKIKDIDKRDGDNFGSATDSAYVTKLSKEFRSSFEDNDNLSDWTKSKLVESGLAEIRKQLDADPRFKRTMESLWAQAKSSGYSNDLKSRIVSTALARAKSLVPKVRAKLLAEALSGGKKKKKDDTEKEEKRTNVSDFKKKESKTPDSTKKPLTDMDILRGVR